MGSQTTQTQEVIIAATCHDAHHVLDPVPTLHNIFRTTTPVEYEKDEQGYLGQHVGRMNASRIPQHGLRCTTGSHGALVFL